MHLRVTTLTCLVALAFFAQACDTASIVALFRPPATAAAPSGPPRIYLASDLAGANETYTFSQRDTVYLLIDARGIPAGTEFDMKWYGLDVFTANPGTPIAYHNVSHDGRSPTVEVWLGSSNFLAPGHYRVDVFQNGTKIGEREFTVE